MEVKKGLIKTVNGFRVGQYFIWKGNRFIVTGFPTRHMVTGEYAGKKKSASATTIKVPIRETTYYVGK